MTATGSKIHCSNRDDNYGSSFGPGDIIGCYLFLDDQNPLTNQMRFFKNGKDQGIAYSGKELPPGVYFPAVSVYMKVSPLDQPGCFFDHRQKENDFQS